MSDNGAAMMAEEFTCGLHTLGIVHQTTLPYSPQQNGKQEVFWARLEGRLMAMLEGVSELTLELLNTATQAWVEHEYQRTQHSELDATPLARFLEGPTVMRECPQSQVLRGAFRMELTRTQRRSDGTVSLEGRRFEIPSRYRHLQRVHLRYARWDLAAVELIDARRGTVLCALYPIDKSANASGRRRALDPLSLTDAPPLASGIAPLLRRLMAEYAATGLPPAYIPTEQDPSLMSSSLIALYGLKWNPFSQELPTEALRLTRAAEDFLWRIEHNHVREGGFALVHGDPGTGKSVVLRLLAERLGRLPDVSVAVLNHPQSNLADFYRELGDLFEVGLKPHNRWGGFKNLRERWIAHLEGTRLRPVLLIDEAQEMNPATLLGTAPAVQRSLRLPAAAEHRARGRQPTDRDAQARRSAAPGQPHPGQADDGIRQPRRAHVVSRTPAEHRRQRHQ